ncbi:MAG: hypothetical protein ACI9J3_004050 [Parvicellaceae bacterium]|jgi:hypothetical protein
MRIHYSLAFITGLLISNISFSQFNPTVPPSMGEGEPFNMSQTKAMASCGNDTLLYTLSKATVTEIQSVSFPASYVEVAQKYRAPQDITVYGLCYYAAVDASGSGPANIELHLYDVDGLGLPGTVLATTIDAVPISSSQNRRCVTWLVPVTVSGDYYVSVDGFTTAEPLGVSRNSFAFADGGAEGNSAVYFDDLSGASYVKWYDQTNDPLFTSPGPAWDYDYLIEPIVSYDLYLATTFGADSICAGDSYCVTADSISPIFWDNMYNTNISVQPNTDWDDGSNSVGDSVCHIYSTQGNYMISQTMNLSGWEISCSVTELDSVAPKVVAGFTYVVSNDTVVFTNTSTGGSGSSWDFDGIGSSTALDTTFVFPSNGAFVVEQIVWNAAGCADTVSQTVNITVGIEENNLPQISIYPNPSNGMLNIVNSVSVEEFNVVIMDMTGKILSRQVINGSVNTIDLSQFANGQYLIQIGNQSGVRVDRIQIIK